MSSQAVAVAQVIVGPTLAAERAAGADGEHDLVGGPGDAHRLPDERAVLRRRRQHDLIGVLIAARDQLDPRRVNHMHAMAREVADALQNADGVSRHLGVAAEARDAGIGADHGERPDPVGVEGQGAVVLEENDALLRGLHGERARIGSQSVIFSAWRASA